MKTCHHCHAEFESGLTCPSCHGFVPDMAPRDDLWEEALPTPSLGDWITTGSAGPDPLDIDGIDFRPGARPSAATDSGARPVVAGERSVMDAAFGAVLGPDEAPAVPALDPYASTGTIDASAPIDPRDRDPYDGVDEPAPTGPSWAASSAALHDEQLRGDDATPPSAAGPRRDTASAAPTTHEPAPPRHDAIDTRAIAFDPASAVKPATGANARPESRAWTTPAVDPSPAREPSATLPAAYPAWARQAPDETPAPPPTPPPTAEWIQPPSLPRGAGDWAAPATQAANRPMDAAGPGARPGAPPFGGPGAPGPGAFPYAPPGFGQPAPGFGTKPGFTLTPATLAFGLGALLVIVLLAALVFRPSGASQNQVAADIAGSCFTYNSDHSRLDRPVPCEEQHDGTVLGFATDQTKCPAGTDAILTSSADTFGKNGVLCVDERE